MCPAKIRNRNDPGSHFAVKSPEVEKPGKRHADFAGKHYICLTITGSGGGTSKPFDMKFSELAKIRQSNRKYLDRPVEAEKIAQCLETARISPSANNAQPWKFVVVDDPELKNRLADCAASLGMNKFAVQAQVIVAVVLEKTGALSSVASVIQDKEYPLLDVGIAVNQFCLQAADLGLGTCILGWFNEKKVKELLGVPRQRRVPLLITLGYSASETRPKIRKNTEEMSSRNRYR